MWNWSLMANNHQRKQRQFVKRGNLCGMTSLQCKQHSVLLLCSSIKTYLIEKKHCQVKVYRSWMIRPNIFLGSIWLRSLFALFLLENKSMIVQISGHKIFIIKKTWNMCMLMRSPHNCIKLHCLQFTLCTRQRFFNYMY